MTRNHRLHWEQLVDWIAGKSSDEESARAEALLTTAREETQQDAAWLRAFTRLSSAVTLTAPPDSVHEQIIARFEKRADEWRKPNLFQRLVAALSFDSSLQTPAFAGLRGAAVAPRQLIFDSQAIDVAVTIQPQDGLFSMTGQIFPIDDWAGPGDFTVQLLRNSQEAAITTSDELGEFTFQSLPAGSYELVLTSERGEILATLGELA